MYLIDFQNKIVEMDKMVYVVNKPKLVEVKAKKPKRAPRPMPLYASHPIMKTNTNTNSIRKRQTVSSVLHCRG